MNHRISGRKLGMKTDIREAMLKNMVTSPGGTTTQALLNLESGGFRSLIISAVTAAYEKAKALGGN